MKEFNRFILVVAITLAGCSFAHGQDGGHSVGNGGRPNETRFKEIASDIAQWITNADLSALEMPPRLTIDQYRRRMLSALSNYNISFTRQKVMVGKSEKTCKNFVDSKHMNQILCQEEEFAELLKNNLDGAYVIVHHEFAGLAGLEVNTGDDSDYFLSSQITLAFGTRPAKGLAIKELLVTCDVSLLDLKTARPLGKPVLYVTSSSDEKTGKIYVAPKQYVEVIVLVLRDKLLFKFIGQRDNEYVPNFAQYVDSRFIPDGKKLQIRIPLNLKESSIYPDGFRTNHGLHLVCKNVYRPKAKEKPQKWQDIYGLPCRPHEDPGYCSLTVPATNN